jgi:hypothetical protein
MNKDEERQLLAAVAKRFPEQALERVEMTSGRSKPRSSEEPYRELRLIPAWYRGEERPARRFLEEYRPQVNRLIADLPELSGGTVQRLAIVNSGGGRSLVFKVRGSVAEGIDQSTPVMTRLDEKDLETVDYLISAGVGSSRAEVLRWALGVVQELPAFQELRQHVEDLERLKRELSPSKPHGRRREGANEAASSKSTTRNHGF